MLRALGCGMVLCSAITSDRLRRRSEVAGALEVPVPMGVRRATPLPKRWLWLPHLHILDIRRAADRHRLAHVREMELPVPRQWGRPAVVCVDTADQVRFAIATAASNLEGRGCTVTLIDLTERASLDVKVMASISGSTDRPIVLRPGGKPALAGAAAHLHPVGQAYSDSTWPQLTDVTLVLADLDPAVGVEHLTPWTDRVIIVVTAGRSSAEGIRTAADLVRAAGLDLRFGALRHTEDADDSSGVGDCARPAPAQHSDGYDPPESARKFGVR
jgi:hypothetical protein